MCDCIRQPATIAPLASELPSSHWCTASSAARSLVRADRTGFCLLPPELRLEPAFETGRAEAPRNWLGWVWGCSDEGQRTAHTGHHQKAGLGDRARESARCAGPRAPERPSPSTSASGIRSSPSTDSSSICHEALPAERGRGHHNIADRRPAWARGRRASGASGLQLVAPEPGCAPSESPSLFWRSASIAMRTPARAARRGRFPLLPARGEDAEQFEFKKTGGRTDRHDNRKSVV